MMNNPPIYENCDGCGLNVIHTHRIKELVLCEGCYQSYIADSVETFNDDNEPKDEIEALCLYKW